ncbi:hypothetical protein KQX54_017542 [Cotesia glomerata]|uniref:Uncharacterized protein n=1 Tax=Cotesia glomerata TaxID=32391 RepID=A0AAV7IYU3_COTGL|nr:hypothetical protein KQX54_017542 [Cotesia glomerata]
MLRMHKKSVDMIKAIQQKNWKVINEFVANGGDINASLSRTGATSGYTAIHFAILCGNYRFDMEKFIKTFRPNVNGVGADGAHQPIHLAFSSHRHFVESKIDAEVLQRFKNARAAGIGWEADDKYELLYDLWVKAAEDDKNVDNELQSSSCLTLASKDLNNVRAAGIGWEADDKYELLYDLWVKAAEDDKNVDNELQSSSCLTLASKDLNPSIPNDNDIIEFPFPEFSEPILDEGEYMIRQNSHNQNSDFGVPFLLEPPIPLDIDNDSPSVRPILSSSDNAIQSSPVIIEVTEPDAVSSVITENVSNPNTITMRRKSLDEVINEIVMWPKSKKQSSKRKRAVEHLPSVITADKWIEIMEAKEKEKNDKEEEKKIKKIESEERIEKNKKIKQEKLEEKARKKLAKELPAEKSVKPRKMSKN